MLKIIKQGTIDLDIVETNPIVFKGKLWLVEYVRAKGITGPSHGYYGNHTGKPFCRFRSLEELSHFSAPFGEGFCFASAFADNDRIFVTVTECWGGHTFYLLESEDMVHWSEPRVFFSDPAKYCYNSAMFKAGDRYLNALEMGSHGDCSDNAVVFMESRDGAVWQMLPQTGAELAPPCVTYHDGVYYAFALCGNYDQGFETCVFRSKDLKAWEASAANPVMTFDDEDRKIHPQANLTTAQQATIKAAKNINVSDLGLCEWHGKTVISYSWGDQAGHEFLALAEVQATEKKFCESFFPEEE